MRNLWDGHNPFEKIYTVNIDNDLYDQLNLRVNKSKRSLFLRQIIDQYISFNKNEIERPKCKRISFRVDEALESKMESLCYDNYYKINDIVRAALIAYFNDQDKFGRIYLD
jgi:metal-responsive CopG/Arc/MetJ family transcriptional regulator